LLAESFPDIRTGKTILIRLYRRLPFPKGAPDAANQSTCRPASTRI
jgi:hypothetical protein